MRRREVCPNSWSRHPNQMLFTPTTQWTFGENMWRSFMESPHFNTSSIRDKWHRWKSYSTSKRRHFCSTATIRIGWKVVVWLYGMLLLSAKRPRPPGRWEKLRVKDDLENHSKGQWYILEQWLNIIWFHWQESVARNLSWLWVSRGVNWDKKFSDSRSWKIGKVGCIRNLSLKNQR